MKVYALKKNKCSLDRARAAMRAIESRLSLARGTCIRIYLRIYLRARYTYILARARYPPGCPRTAVECRSRTHIHAAQEDRGRVR